MAVDEFLYQRSELLVVAVLLGLLLVVTEVGFRRGRVIRASLEDSAKSELTTLQGAMIGLLALLLAFSFAMAESRFDTRRQLVTAEANAIGTTDLRSKALAEPYQVKVVKLLQDSVGNRLEYYAAGMEQQNLDEVNNQTDQLQTQLWSQAMDAANKDPHSIPAGLFISSLNEVIDLRTKRDIARQNHVPESVLLLLFLVAILAMGIVGFGCGIGDWRNLSVTVTMSLIITLVILVTMDLDRPRRGLIRVVTGAWSIFRTASNETPHERMRNSGRPDIVPFFVVSGSPSTIEFPTWRVLPA